MYKSFSNLAESTAITITNGDGDAFSTIATGLTAAAAAHPLAGRKGATRALTATASQSIMNFASDTGTVATRIVAAFWFRVPSGGSVISSQVISVIDVRATGQQACQVKIRTNLTLILAPANADLVASASPALTPGTWYYVQYAATAGADTSSGVAEFSILNQNGSVFHSYSNAAANCRTAELGEARWGGMVSTGVSGWTDGEILSDPQLVRLSSGWPGLLAVAQTVDAGDNQSGIEPWVDTVTLAGSSSNGSYAWTQISGTTVILSSTTIASPTFTAPPGLAAGESLVFQLSNGIGQTDTVTIAILPAVEFRWNGTAWEPCRLQLWTGTSWA